MRDLSFKEHRKFIRLQAPIGITYRTVKKNKRQKPQLSLIKNISGGGLCFISKDDMRCGDLLDIEIAIPHLAEPVHAVGEVVWYSAGREGREHAEAGVRFRDIEPKDLHNILEYIYSVGIG